MTEYIKVEARGPVVDVAHVDDGENVVTVRVKRGAQEDQLAFRWMGYYVPEVGDVIRIHGTLDGDHEIRVSGIDFGAVAQGDPPHRGCPASSAPSGTTTPAS